MNCVWRPRSGRLVRPGKIARPCVRTSAFLPGFPSGRGLPSARLVLFSFGGIISTTPRSATPPQLGTRLRLSLVDTPFGNQPKAPAGLPGFQRYPFIRDVAFDPGGARTSRSNDGLHAAFNVANRLGLHDFFLISWLNPTPHMTAVYASDPTLP